jgi:hypothetical protein
MAQLRDLKAVLASLADAGVVAVYGASAAAVRDTGRSIVRAAVAESGDDLGLTVLETADLGRVAEAIRARPLGGGRPIVWVPAASEKLAPLADEVMGERGGALLVLGFNERFGRSPLAGRIAAAPRGRLVECRASRADHERALKAMFDEAGITAAADAVAALLGWIESSGQTVAMGGLLAVLAVGPGGHLTLAVLETMGAAPQESGALARAVTAGLAGDRRLLDRAVRDVLDDGQTGVGLIRQTLFSVNLARTGRPGWAGARDAAPAGRIEAAAGCLWEAERLVKRSGMPQELVAAHMVRAIGTA